ncbi:replication protein [Shouchella clausii]|uniref:replication protein n=1 Tax=Shouchella clausii TaxID=79880 RepID=UPI0028A26EBC|nr:replication protein [Shouchella clausii]
MANPQREDGYTGIANEILEQLAKVRLNGTQMRIVLAVIRFTYGFKRKEHPLSVNFLAAAIDSNKRNVQRELESLIKQRVLLASQVGRTRLLGINKNYEEWELSEMEEKKKAAPKKKKEYSPDSTYYKMADYFIRQIKAVAEDAGVPHLTAKADVQKYADDFRKLVELDGIEDKKLILNVMKWATNHHFWHRNILSSKKFREKFGELAIQMKAESKPLPQKKHPSHYQEDSRDREIAFNKFVAAGGDPDEFVYRKDSEY